MFSELAEHPTMKSDLMMMRPQRNGDAVTGPFIEAAALDAVVAEMGRLAIQVGEQLGLFFPSDWAQAPPRAARLRQAQAALVETFYPTAATPARGAPG
jgi:hypothetical protein